MPTLWRLNITTYTGITPMAHHFYASLHGPTKLVVEQLMDAETAAAHAKQDARWSRDYIHNRVGEPTNRFDSEEDAIAAALAVWRAVSQPGDALIQKPSWTIEPDAILAGPEDFVRLGRTIWIGSKTTEYWTGDEPQYDALRRHWELVLQHHGLEEPDGKDENEAAYVKKVDGEWTHTTEDPYDTEVITDLVIPEGS